MEALTLNRTEYKKTIAEINEKLNGETYVNQFEIKFPDGINTANTLEICRVIDAPSFENKVHLMRICIREKVVEVICPNGEKDKICMTNMEDSLEAFPLFQKEPLALMAIADSLYGYILKKYVRLSKPEDAAAKTD